MTIPEFLKTPQPLPIEGRRKTFPYTRFFEKVTIIQDGPTPEKPLGSCWEWTSARHPKYGYGMFWMDRRSWQAHRVAWEFKYGEIPSGLLLLHRCDNPPCTRVDPYGPSELDHFFLGTSQENNTDRDLKGRGVKLIGYNNPNVKLTAEDVREIRRLHEVGKTFVAIAKKYQISPVTASRIARRETWSHIE